MNMILNWDAAADEIRRYRPEFFYKFPEFSGMRDLWREAPEVASDIADVVEIARHEGRLVERALELSGTSLRKNGDMWAQRSLSALNVISEILRAPAVRGAPAEETALVFSAKGPDAGFFGLMRRAATGEFGPSVARGAAALLHSLPGGFLGTGKGAGFVDPFLETVEAAEMTLLPIRNEVDVILMMRDRVWARPFAKGLANDMARHMRLKLATTYEMVAALYNAQSWNHLSARLA